MARRNPCKTPELIDGPMTTPAAMRHPTTIFFCSQGSTSKSTSVSETSTSDGDVSFSETPGTKKNISLVHSSTHILPVFVFFALLDGRASGIGLVVGLQVCFIALRVLTVTARSMLADLSYHASF